MPSPPVGIQLIGGACVGDGSGKSTPAGKCRINVDRPLTWWIIGNLIILTNKPCR